MTLGPRGFLTMAVGKPRYLEMAVDLALSLREFSHLPIALATDQGLRERAETLPEGVFDAVTLVEEQFLRHRAMKYGAARASPFEEALFIDADCLVLASPDSLFERAGPGPLTLIGEPLTLADDLLHHGFSTRRLMGRLGIERYFKNHSGVFHLRRDGAIPLMDECLEAYVGEILPLTSRWRFWEFAGDELGFGLVGGKREFSAFGPPAPVFWGHEMAGLDLEAPLRPILHFIGPLSPPILDRLMGEVRARRERALLPVGVSEQWWRSEVSKATKGWKRTQLARRLLGR